MSINYNNRKPLLPWIVMHLEIIWSYLQTCKNISLINKTIMLGFPQTNIKTPISKQKNWKPQYMKKKLT